MSLPIRSLVRKRILLPQTAFSITISSSLYRFAIPAISTPRPLIRGRRDIDELKILTKRIREFRFIRRSRRIELVGNPVVRIIGVHEPHKQYRAREGNHCSPTKEFFIRDERDPADHGDLKRQQIERQAIDDRRRRNEE